MGLFDELKKLTRPYRGDEYDEYQDEFPEVPIDSQGDLDNQYKKPRRKSGRYDEYESREPRRYESRNERYESEPRYEERRSESRQRYESPRRYDEGRNDFSQNQYSQKEKPRDTSFNSFNSFKGNDGQKIIYVTPSRFDAATEIAEHIKDRRTVILEISAASPEDTKRILDFLGGAAYVLDANVSKLGEKTLVISPEGVEVKADNLGGLGMNNNSEFRY